jgi:hypothetical protein
VGGLLERLGLAAGSTAEGKNTMPPLCYKKAS